MMAQFLSKKKQVITLFFYVLTIGSISSQKDTLFYIYPFQLGSCSTNSACDYQSDLEQLNNKFEKDINQLGRQYYFQSDVLPIYDARPLNTGKGKAIIEVIPFLFCDNGFITLRLFYTNFNEPGKLVGQNFLYGFMTTDSMLQILGPIIKSNHINNKNLEKSYFDDSMIWGKVKHYNDLRSDNTIIRKKPSLINPNKKYTVNDLIFAVQNYCNGNDPGGVYVTQLFDAGNLQKNLRKSKAQKSLGAISDPTTVKIGKKTIKKTKLIWRLIDNIRYFEGYRNKNNPTQDNFDDVKRKIENLVNDDSEFLTNELESYMGAINIDSVIAVFNRGFKISYDCNNIIQQIKALEAGKKTEEIATMYFSILNTVDITKITADNNSSAPLANGQSDCNFIKKDALAWCQNYFQEKETKYRKALEQADRHLAGKRYQQALSSYNEADDICKSLSLYPQRMIDTVSNILGIKQANSLKDIDKILNRNLKSSQLIGSLNQKWDKVTASNKEVVYKFYQDESLIKGWFVEFQYRKGSYFSGNDALLSENMASTINLIIEKLGGNVKEVKLHFTGLADNIGFISDNPLKIFHPEYERIQENVCNCSIKSFCPSFQELKVGKLKKESKGLYTGDTDIDALKNLGLAYLRAYHRKTLIMNKIDARYNNLVTYDICPMVSKNKGDAFRYVNVEMTVILR